MWHISLHNEKQIVGTALAAVRKNIKKSIALFELPAFARLKTHDIITPPVGDDAHIVPDSAHTREHRRLLRKVKTTKPKV